MTVNNTKTYSFAQITFYDKFAHCLFNKDHKVVSKEQALEIVTSVNKYYGNQSYVMISERGLNTEFNSEIIKSLELYKMKGLAIVSPDVDSRRKQLIEEQGYFEGSFAFFETFDAAKEWALTF
ncbi:MAG: hypothetical protein NWQ06_03795 [Leeuwenhoekiella sp.]|nr:hypothetical protein [Leeuwenhoekiella sp.]